MSISANATAYRDGCDREIAFRCKRSHLLTYAATLHNMFVMKQSGYGQASSNRLDMTFAALANPTRRAILARLASGEVSVSELAEPFSMSQPAVSRHLKVLERA